MGNAFNKFPVLETERLSLVQITKEHIADLFELFGNTKVSEYLYYDYKSIQDAADTIEVFDNWYKEGSGIRWGIKLKNNPQILGTIYVTFYEKGNSGNFGYDLNKKYWNKGITSEAAAEVCNFALRELSLKTLTARTGVENPASQKVLEKNGFKRERILETKEFYNGKEYEQILYIKKLV